MNCLMKRTYWLVFRNGNLWHQRFLKKGFGHVFVIMSDGRQWLKLDPRVNRLEPEILGCSRDVYMPKVYRHLGYSVVKIVLNEQKSPKNIFRPFWFLTCIEIIKYIIGLKLPFCYTPYSLYKKLLKINKLQYGIEQLQLIY